MPREKKNTVGDSTARAVCSCRLEFPMREELDIANITGEVEGAVKDSGLSDGTVTVFVPGATGAVTCLEYEPGVVADFKEAMERLVPRNGSYLHNRYQADGNGHAHVRAGLIGPSLAIPFIGGELTMGTWQQIVLVNCDNRRRTRRVIVQVAGT